MVRFLSRLRHTFALDRIICRTIASWIAFCALTLLFSEQTFDRLSFGQDIRLGTMLGSIAAFFVAFSILSCLLWRRVQTDSLLLLGAAWIFAGTLLFRYHHAENEFLFALAVILPMSLITVWVARQNEELLDRTSRPITGGIILASALLSFGVIAVIGCLRYLTFSAPNYDFGLFVNMFHNMKESGQPLITSERDRLLSHFAVHISPVFYLLLPFYMLFPSPLTLQIGQAAILLLGIVPVWLLCRYFRLSNTVTAVVCALFAAYPALSAGTFYDLHENCFLVPCLLFTFLFFEKRKYIPMYLSALLTLSVKEDAAIYLLIFALFVLLSERRPLHGTILAAMSIGYFLLAVFLLEKYGLGIMSNRFDNLIYEPSAGLGGAIKTALVNPGYLLTQLFTTPKAGFEKLIYAAQMLLPLGLLPFCSKKASRWLLLSPMLVNLLTNYQYQYDIGFQYHFAATAFLFYAAIKNLRELTFPTRRALLSVAVAACACLYIATVMPKLSAYTTRYADAQQTYDQMEAVLDTVPSDASVACSTFLLAHIADRSEIYELGYHGNKSDIDYVIIDHRYASGEKYLQTYLNLGYSVTEEIPDLITVLKK